MKNLIVPSVLIMLTCFSASAQITIQYCQEKGKANFPAVKQYDLISKSLEYTISNANKAYLPQVSVTGIGGYIIRGLPAVSLPGTEPTSEDKLKFIATGQINQVIWDGGATRASKGIAEAGAAVERANVDVLLYSIGERVNQLFFGILVIDEQLEHLTLVNANLTRNVNKLQLSKENGLALQPDVDELKAELLSLEQKKIEFAFTRKGYVEMLSYVIGEELLPTVHLEKPSAGEPVASLANNRPELNVFSNQRKLIMAQSSMNRATNLPKIGVLGAGLWITPGASFATSQVSSLAIAGLSVSWSTAGLYRTSNNKSLDQLQINRIASQQETFLFTNNLQQKAASSEIEKQNAIIENDDAIVDLKAKIRNAYQLKYDNGLCAMNDLINAVNRENEARSNRSLHRIQLLMSIYNYKTISGN